MRYRKSRYAIHKENTIPLHMVRPKRAKVLYLNINKCIKGKRKTTKTMEDQTKTHDRAKTKLTKSIIRKSNPIPNIGLSKKIKSFIPPGESNKIETHICQTIRTLISFPINMRDNKVHRMSQHDAICNTLTKITTQTDRENYVLCHLCMYVFTCSDYMF